MLKRFFSPLVGIILVITIAGSWLRSTGLPNQGILFGDAGRDLLLAAESVKIHHLPLLGIPSSVPRFHQGPLTLWLEMLLFFLTGYDHTFYALIFALLSALAIPALYQLTRKTESPTAAVFAAGLLAFSPLAIAQGRMVYHIVPIPLVLTFYLWSLLKLKASAGSIFWVWLSFWLLFQFELAVIPLILLLPYVMLRRFSKSQLHTLVRQKSVWLASLAALLIGLWPQLLSDLTHAGVQTAGFAAWVGYRLLGTTGVGHTPGLSPTYLSTAMSELFVYLNRIIGFELPIVTLILSGLWLWAFIPLIRRIKNGQSVTAPELGLMGSAILGLSFLIHGHPSEAHVAPLLILFPLSLTGAVMALPHRVRVSLVPLVIALALYNSINLKEHSFLVSTTYPWNYGPSIAEQRDILELIAHHTDGQFHLRTTDEGGKFKTYFDNFRWVAAGDDLREQINGRPLYIESKDSALKNYPGSQRFEFESRDVYVIPGL